MKRIGLCIGMMLMTSIAGGTAQAAVNDFTITDYDIQYSLSRDGEKHSVLKTTETITAVFPNTNQNHGLERALPKSYDGHSTNLIVESVKRTNGRSWHYQTTTSNDNLVVRIGDADRYLHGPKTFIITYTQRDVTRHFQDTNSDEFSWDANGTEWGVPIQNLSVTTTVSRDMKDSLTGSRACYQGKAGSNYRCELVLDQATFTAQASQLNPGENVTISIGFMPNTFATYTPTLWERLTTVYIASLVVIGVISIGLFAWLISRYSRWSNRTKDLSTIVPEYTPPRDVSLTAAASLHASPGSVFTAQLLDLAVRHYLKIYQTRDKSLFKAAEYDIEIVRDISDLRAEEREILGDIFGGTTQLGSRISLKSLQNNTKVYKSMLNNDKNLKALVRGEYGLRAKNAAQSGWFKKFGIFTLVMSIVLLNPALLAIAVTAFICASILWPLTDKGLALSRYLEGLKMYIGVAETERLKLLQSPEGAAKVGPVNPGDTGSLVKLYEGVLPFAVLFGQEKQWSKQIGSLYESIGKNPEWYGGNTAAFNAVIFSSAMSGFSTAASYSSASSSTSGGSGGGGSSGGGGGGGGGGGW